MKKITIFVLVFLFSALMFCTNSLADEYVPITEESVMNLVEHVRHTFYAKEFPDSKWPAGKTNILVVDPNTNNSETWESLGLIGLEPQVWVLGFAWPQEYGLDDPFYHIPKKIIKNPTIPLYFIFNTVYCNTMNDMAIQGIVIHDFMHLFQWSKDVDNVSLYTDQGYSFREKAIDSLVIATKDPLGVTPLMYEFAKWGEIAFPPLGEEGLTQAAGLTPDDIKLFYNRIPNLYQYYVPGVPLEYLLSPATYEAYIYLQNN